MKIRSITLSNVRRFAGQTATISGIGDGISVIAERNEFGKSTFFDALHALFFMAHRTTDKTVKSLQPLRQGGAVTVMADLDLAKGRFRIEKRFLSRPMARVTDLGTGALIAQDDEAEAWIAGLTDQGLRGPTGLLWVRQGATTLASGDRSENARHLTERRNLLSSVAGEIDLMTGGQRMDRVRDRCMAELDALASSTGKPKAGGRWRALRDEMAELTATVTDLTAKCRALSDALQQRREIEVRLAALEDTGARAVRQTALTAAQTAMAAADAHAARLSDAAQQVELATLHQRDRAGRLASLVKAIAATVTARRTATDQTGAEAELAGRVAAAQTEETKALDDLNAATAEVKRLRDRLTTLRQQAAKSVARTRRAELAARLADAEQQRAAVEQAEATLAANRATPDRITTLDRAIADLAQARAVAAAQAVTLTLQYDGPARVKRNGADLPEGVTALTGRTALDLPGIGTLTVDPGAAGQLTDASKLDRATAAVAAALTACGAASPEAAHQAQRDRQEAENAGRLAKTVLASLAPDGLAALRAVWAATVDAAGDDAGIAEPEGDPATLDLALSNAEAAEDEARLRADAVRKTVAALTADRAAARMGAALALTAQEEAEAAAGDPASRATRLAEAEADAAQAGANLKAAEVLRDTITANAPDIITARAELSRATSVVGQIDREVKTLREERARLAGMIQTQADQAIEERLAEAQGALDAVTEREARTAADVAALIHLRDVLEAVRTEAQDAYFGPVQRELQPLLAILASDAALTFDPDSLLPGALARQGAEEPVETLSGGTQEQIAILTRLAFARLFAKAGRPVPVILDDALVHTDDDRIVRMFTALHRVAADQQVIVFTCRQMAFQALGGERPEVTVV